MDNKFKIWWKKYGKDLVSENPVEMAEQVWDAAIKSLNGKLFACHLERDMRHSLEYTICHLDYKNRQDKACSFASDLNAIGKAKTNCKYYREIRRRK